MTQIQKTINLSLLACSLVFGTFVITNTLFHSRIPTPLRACPHSLGRINVEMFKTFGYPTSDGCTLTLEHLAGKTYKDK